MLLDFCSVAVEDAGQVNRWKQPVVCTVGVGACRGGAVVDRDGHVGHAICGGCDQRDRGDAEPARVVI